MRHGRRAARSRDRGGDRAGGRARSSGASAQRDGERQHLPRRPGARRSRSLRPRSELVGTTARAVAGGDANGLSRRRLWLAESDDSASGAPCGRGTARAAADRRDERQRHDGEGERVAVLARQAVGDERRRQHAGRNLTTNRTADRSHDRVHPGRDSGLIRPHGLDDQVRHRGERESDARSRGAPTPR